MWIICSLSAAPRMRGLSAADNIVALKDELEINVKNSYFILNRVPGEIPAPLQERINKIDVPFLGSVPWTRVWWN